MNTSESGGDTLTAEELQSLQGMEPAPAGNSSLRFVQRCQDWCKEWIDANTHALLTNAEPTSQILMLIFVEAPEVEHPSYNSLKSELNRVFANAHAQNTQGVVLCNENFRQMYRIRPSIDSLDGAFALALKHLGPEHTFAIASLSQRRLFFHLPSASIEDWCDAPTLSDLRLSSMPLSAAKIEADIEEFHEENLRYAKSRVSQMVWKEKALPYKLERLPEQRIQGYLLVHLRGNYKHFKGIVDEEIVGKGGRSDIRVMWPSPLGSPYDYTTTMLELKVLSEGKGPAYHREWVSGITQAEQYRQANTEAVYTCVFDARKDQSDQMPDLDKVAEEKCVRLRRYLMEAPLAGKKQDIGAGEPDEDREEESALSPKASRRPGRGVKPKTKKIVRQGG